MNFKIRNFIYNETGSVTTDWVVLVAAIILLSVLVTASITGGTMGVSQDLSSNLATMEAG